MRTLSEAPAPALFTTSPHFCNEINRRIIQSEIEGGVYLRDLRCGDVLTIETRDWVCTLEYCGGSEALVSGHPQFCPEPVRVHIAGSTWGGSMLKQDFIGRSMHLEFIHPRHHRIVTSPILDIFG